MARLFGLVGNRPDLGGPVLLAESAALSVRVSEPPAGWGMAFFQGGEVLLRRRPVDDRSELDVAKLAADVRADAVVGHVRRPTTGSLQTENTHPFRYRQWVFAQTGTVPNFAHVRSRMLERVPEFLRGGIRGDTDAELVFHLMLSFMHDQGAFDGATVEPPAIIEAMRSTYSLLESLVAEEGSGVVGLNWIVSGGEYVVGARRGASMATRIYRGKSDADTLIGDDLSLRRKVPEMERMYFAMVASDFDSEPPPTWSVIGLGAFVVATRTSLEVIAS